MKNNTTLKNTPNLNTENSRILILNLGVQLRHLSLSVHRFNPTQNIVKEEVTTTTPEAEKLSLSSPEASQSITETSNEASEELILKIPTTVESSSVSNVASTTVESSSVSTVANDKPPNELVFDIPEKPVPLDLPEVLGEPAFDTLGLASWWPSGRMQYLMENIHIGLELEWWQTIAVTTVLMRLLLFPVVVMAQRNMANMANHSPQLAVLQEKMTDARRRGDMFESAKLGQELQMFMKKKGVNPLKNAVPIFLQIPVFMSFFFALRGMAKCPVESMASGGIFWFEDLTLCDPFYLLPFLTSSTLYLQLRLGAEGARLDMMGPKMKIAMTVLPFIMLPITINFPCAVTFYWCTTNFISLCQAQVLKVPSLRKALKIPIMIKHEPKSLAPGKKKGFTESFRDTLDNWKVQGQIQDRRAYDEQQFREAGSKKPMKTFKYDPTKPVAISQLKK